MKKRYVNYGSNLAHSVQGLYGVGLVTLNFLVGIGITILIFQKDDLKFRILGLAFNTFFHVVLNIGIIVFTVLNVKKWERRGRTGGSDVIFQTVFMLITLEVMFIPIHVGAIIDFMHRFKGSFGLLDFLKLLLS